VYGIHRNYAFRIEHGALLLLFVFGTLVFNLPLSSSVGTLAQAHASSPMHGKASVAWLHVLSAGASDVVVPVLQATCGPTILSGRWASS
jgi:hypothetical protein